MAEPGPLQGLFEIEPSISFRNVERSDALDRRIVKGIKSLAKTYDRLITCRVSLDRSRQGRHSGDLYTVRIDLSVPGSDIQVNRAPPERATNEDVLVAVGHAFDVARRRLREFARKQRGEVKTHVEQARGRVVQLPPEGGFGFIEGADGREFYFHEHSVLNEGFDVLEVGSEVQFVEGRGQKGPTATTVIPVSGRQED